MTKKLILFSMLAASCLAQAEMIKPVALATATAVHPWGNSTPVYEATSTLLVTDKFFRQDYLKAEQNVNPSKADFAYFVTVARSNSVLMGVWQRLKGDGQEGFMKGLQSQQGIGDLSPTDLLKQSIQVDADPDALTIRFTCTHPDAVVAASVANQFAQETINYQLKMAIDTLMKRVEDLRVRADVLQNEVEKLSKKEMSETVKIEYDQAKKLYSELVDELIFSKMQVNMVNPGVLMLDEALTPDHPTSPSL